MPRIIRARLSKKRVSLLKMGGLSCDPLRAADIFTAESEQTVLTFTTKGPIGLGSQEHFALDLLPI